MTKMADACPGLGFDRLFWTADWHVREETYAKALAEIINSKELVDTFGIYTGMPCGCVLIAYLGLSTILDGSPRTLRFQIDDWQNHIRCELR